MPVQIGYLDSLGHPDIKIRVYGIREELKQEFEAMIDTGFTGFLSMPLVSALPLALTLSGTASYTLADGSQSPKLLATGVVEIGQGLIEKVEGAIVLEGSNNASPLLGMEFLRKLERCLFVSKLGVVLWEEKELAAELANMTQQNTEENKEH